MLMAEVDPLPNPSLAASYSAGTLSITLNNPPDAGAPSSVNVTVAGQILSVPLTNNQGSLALSVDPSLQTANILCPLAIPASEQTTPQIPNGWAQLGTQGGAAVGVQLVAPAAAGDPYLLGPTSKATLRRYYSGLMASMAQAQGAQTQQGQDLYTMVSVLCDWAVNTVNPHITGAAFAQVQLTPDQANAWDDIKANVVAHFSQTQDTIYPSGGSRSMPYADVVADAPKFEAALASYEKALTVYPNLTD